MMELETINSAKVTQVIDYRLDLDETGYPVGMRYQSTSPLKILGWMTGGLDIYSLIINFPDYDLGDAVTIFTLTAVSIVFLVYPQIFEKERLKKHIYLNEERVNWAFNILNSAKFEWKDVKKVEIYTYKVKFILHNRKTFSLSLKQYFAREVYFQIIQEIKLVVRALGIKLNIPTDEFLDCRKEQEFLREIKKKKEKQARK